MFGTREGSARQLRRATSSGNLSQVRRILEKEDAGGSTAITSRLSCSSNTSTTSIINMPCDKSGWTALHFASHYGYFLIVQALLLHPQSSDNTMEIQDHNGQTPICLASRQGHYFVVQLLLNHGANVEGGASSNTAAFTTRATAARMTAKFSRGWTPLHIASFHGHASVVRMLLSRNANLWAKTPDRQTPLDLAMDQGHDPIVDYLLLLQEQRNQQKELPAKSSKSTKTKRQKEEEEQNQHVIVPTSKKEQKASSQKKKSKKKSKSRSRSNSKDSSVENEGSGSSFLDILLSSPQRIRQEDENDNHTSNTALTTTTPSTASTAITVREVHEELVAAISNIFEWKLHYTLLKFHWHQKVLTTTQVQELVLKSLSDLVTLCNSEDALVVFQLILDKCFADGLLSRVNYYRMINRAQVQRMEHAAFVVDIKTKLHEQSLQIHDLQGRVQVLSQNIEVLHENVSNMHENVTKIQTGLRQKMKMEAGVAMISLCLNAVSFGIAGSVADIIGHVFDHVIDFGDAMDIVAVIQDGIGGGGVNGSSDAFLLQENGTIDFEGGGDNPHNPQLQLQHDQGMELKADLENGIKLAIMATAAGATATAATTLIADRKLKQALDEGKPLVAIGFAATVLNPTRHSSDNSDKRPSLESAIANMTTTAPKSSDAIVPIQSPNIMPLDGSGHDDNSFAIWSDAIFEDSQEDSSLELHHAVKYSDQESLVRFLESSCHHQDDSPRGSRGDNGNDEKSTKATLIVNKVDSKGRTALDLAALTGQMGFMGILEDYEAIHKTQTRPQMRAKAKKRSSHVERYKTCVLNSID